jgi:hypothetical protein
LEKKNHIKEIYGKKARRRNMEKMWRMKRENQREREAKERERAKERARKKESDRKLLRKREMKCIFLGKYTIFLGKLSCH